MESSVTTCCICLERMNPPIRTLPCLHSSCSSCIQQLINSCEKPFKCLQCRSPFKAPSSSTSTSSSFEPNYFTSHLLASSSSSSAGQDDFDPNEIKCELCEEIEAEEYCKDCGQFFCGGCKRGHKKVKATIGHQFVSINEGAKFKTSTSSTSSSSSSSRITRCQKHLQYEVNSYCEKCQEACCSECVVDSHSGHQFVRLASISEQFKGDISTLINKMKKYDTELSEAIKEIADALGVLKKQAKLTEGQVHQVFNKLRLLLDEREAELIGDIEKENHEKEKELMIQKNDLEFLLKGIRDSVNFSERLVTEGNGVEIAASHHPVAVRYETLETEVKKTSLSPVTDGIIEFRGRGTEDPKKIIEDIGVIVMKGVISAEKSSIVRNENAISVSLNHISSFDLILVDQKGNQAVGTGRGVRVIFDGPSKEVKVDFIEKPGEEGKILVSFILNQVGDHNISVLFEGNHLQGSPFKLKVTEKPVYRRDYGLVGDQPVVRFGSERKW